MDVLQKVNIWASILLQVAYVRENIGLLVVVEWGR